MTAALTVSFMMRNTSPIGWPPLLLIKIIYERSLVPFIKAGLFVFLPLVATCVICDSFYYGMESFPVLTSYNFMQVNLTEGLSRYFGTEPFQWYIVEVMPKIFTVIFPCLIAAFYVYPRDMLKSGSQQPYMFYVSSLYLLVFSAIPHKESRFMLPIVPFCFLMIGYFLVKQIKTE